MSLYISIGLFLIFDMIKIKLFLILNNYNLRLVCFSLKLTLLHRQSYHNCSSFVDHIVYNNNNKKYVTFFFKKYYIFYKMSLIFFLYFTIIEVSIFFIRKH